MADLAALPPLREVIRRHDLAARRSLGQHFLLDLNLTGRIARAAGDLSQGTVIEIGPGPGGGRHFCGAGSSIWNLFPPGPTVYVFARVTGWASWASPIGGITVTR